jgi:hypothetical protein
MCTSTFCQALLSGLSEIQIHGNDILGVSLSSYEGLPLVLPVIISSLSCSGRTSRLLFQRQESTMRKDYVGIRRVRSGSEIDQLASQACGNSSHRFSAYFSAGLLLRES